MSNLDKVREWRVACGLPMNTGEVSELAIKLIWEEANELIGAIQSGDLKEVAKEACDFEYVVLGAALELGCDVPLLEKGAFKVYHHSAMSVVKTYVEHFIKQGLGADTINGLRVVSDGVFHCFFPEKDFDTAFAEVHRSNMSKFVDGKCLRREDGKILKGPNYSPADMGLGWRN